MARPSRKALLPAPEDIVAGYLAPDEDIVLEDKPAIGEFYLLSLPDLAMLALFFAMMIWLFANSHPAFALIAFLVTDFLAIRLLVRRLKNLYTRYVITDLRIMRVSGVFSRVAYSIPLGKITDVAYSQTWWERTFEYATIEIDSASEKSGLDRLRGLHNPDKFNKTLLQMISDKQGFVVTGTAAMNKRVTAASVQRDVRLGAERRGRQASLAQGADDDPSDD